MQHTSYVPYKSLPWPVCPPSSVPSPRLWGRPNVPVESRRFLAVTVNSRLLQEKEKVRITRVCLLSEAPAWPSPCPPHWHTDHCYWCSHNSKHGQCHTSPSVHCDSVIKFICDISISKQQHLVRSQKSWRNSVFVGKQMWSSRPCSCISWCVY